MPLPGAVPTTTPIYASSTFLSENAADLDEVLGGARASYVYSRYANPTVAALERRSRSWKGGWRQRLSGRAWRRCMRRCCWSRWGRAIR